MLMATIAMFLILGVAAVVMLIVLPSTEGQGRTRTRMARAAQHLNGEVEVPHRLERLVHRDR